MIKYKKIHYFLFVCFALLPSLKVEDSLSGLSKDFSGTGVHQLPMSSVIYGARSQKNQVVDKRKKVPPVSCLPPRDKLLCVPNSR